MRRTAVAIALWICGIAVAANAQDSIETKPSKQPPPDAVSDEIRGSINTEGYRLLDQHGNLFAEVWLRKAIPAAHKPEGPKGVIQFPFLADGELLGVLQFAADGHDFREQTIDKGVYTMRYGLQPLNGDHRGVSSYRDFILLLPAIKDKAIAPPARKSLEERSAESAGASHPAAFLLLTPPASSTKPGSVIHDEEKNTWGVVLPLSLLPKGKTDAVATNVLLIVIGAATV